MNYDHLLLPSGSASAATIDAYLQQQQGRPESAIVAELAERINAANAALPESDRFLSEESVGGGETGAVLHIPCAYDAIGYVRDLLFAEATPRDYALYDPQLDWLIDPTDKVEVVVTHGGAGDFPYLTRELTETFVASLVPPNPYLIVERAENEYIQTYKDQSGAFTLEYRDGGADKHFGTDVEGDDLVATLLWDWATGEQTRLSQLTWSRVEF